jgi:hypothetical protein
MKEKMTIVGQGANMTKNTDPNLFSSTICWFCEKNSADPSLAIKYNLEKNQLVKRYGKQRTFEIQKRTVIVPQCRYCKEIREKSSGFPWIPTLAFFTLAAIFSYLLETFTTIGPLGYCIGIPVAILIAGLLSAYLSTLREKKEGWTEEDKQIIAKNPDNFPTLKELKESDWQSPDAAARSRRSS